jgi:hypothetical protein
MGNDLLPRVYNFAVSGATAEDSLSDQLSHFSNSFSSKVNGHPTPALDSDETVH